MSKLNKIFNTVPVQIPDRSGFDLSHEVLTTAKTGTVIPITHLEVLPGDTISMGTMMKVTLPPFAVPFMGRVDAELTAAFIPNRLLWQGWQSFITNNNGVNTSDAPFKMTGDGRTIAYNQNGSNVPINVPLVDGFSGFGQSFGGHPLNGPGSLNSYLGFKLSPSSESSSEQWGVSMLPYLAYHKFCDDWIRDENIIKPFFPKVYTPRYAYPVSGGISTETVPGMNPHILPFDAAGDNYDSVNHLTEYNFSLESGYWAGSDVTPYSNMPIGALRQRCWSKDYFTSATTRPQAGADSQVFFNVTGSAELSGDNAGDVSATGGFTIATLRAANSLQKWLERNNIAGTEYGSQILAHFGVTPPDSTLNRSVLLGSVRTPVVVSSIENTTGTGDTTGSGSPLGTKSPYGNTLGAAAGFGSGYDKGNLVDDFTAKEHGFIMVFFTLIPHQYYNTGIDRSLLHRYVGDFGWPEFAGIGDQPIMNAELSTNRDNTFLPGTWGYQQRYVEYKHKLDVVSGLLQDGQNLSAYALQRGFNGVPSLSAEFLEIPTNYLDQVLGVSSDVGGFGCIIDAYFDCSALRVLPEYSLPHL